MVGWIVYVWFAKGVSGGLVGWSCRLGCVLWASLANQSGAGWQLMLIGLTGGLIGVDWLGSIGVDSHVDRS